MSIYYKFVIFTTLVFGGGLFSAPVIKNIPNLPKINFLNIDCEGHDFSVLKSFNLKYYKPELVCIETHDSNNEETFHYKNIINLFNENGYTFLEKCGLSSIFTLK